MNENKQEQWQDRNDKDDIHRYRYSTYLRSNPTVKNFPSALTTMHLTVVSCESFSNASLYSFQSLVPNALGGEHKDTTAIELLSPLYVTDTVGFDDI